MDLLKQQLARIQEQLGGLNASQKMLAGTLVTIMVMTLLWWSRYAGSPEMEPLLNQSFTEDDIARITMKLASRGISYHVNGDKIEVPADRKFEVLADLSYDQLLPRDTKSGFDEIAKQLSPFDPESKQDVFYNHAKELTLAQVIRQFPEVRNAIVLIDPTRERRIDGSVQPSATVNITMRSGSKLDKKLVKSSADLLAGAVSTLQRSRISVIVDGVSQHVADAADGSMAGGAASGDEYIESVQSAEASYVNKISTQLSFIRGVIASVTVEVNTKQSETHRHLVDPKVVSTPLETTEHHEETTNSSPAGGGEPGAGANTSLVVNSGSSGGGGSTSSTDETKTKFDVHTSETEETVRAPAGTTTVVAATVRVPRSYFVGIFKARTPKAGDPDDAVLKPLIQPELDNIREDVIRCTGIKDPKSVWVATYTDTELDLQAPAAVAATNSATVTAVLTGHYKEIGVALLAVVSLFMVSNMVRKATPPAPPAIVTEPKVVSQLLAEHDIAGEVGEADTMLDAVELDQDTIKAHEMVDQVSNMVKENPDAAANLVKRWLSRA